MGNKKGYWAGTKNPKFKHGLCKHPAYRVWYDMMRRCYNQKSGLYKYYGSRGITVCPRWHDPEAFCEDVGAPPEGCSLERKKNDVGYNPDNCMWADRYTQANNTRANVLICVDGVSKTVSQWSRETGLATSVIFNRVRRGWPSNLILSTENFRGQKWIFTK